MNQADIITFLTPVIANASVILQLSPLSPDLDLRVSAAASSALAMIEAYLNRSVTTQTYIDRYYEQDTLINLKVLPVSSITSVRFVDNPFGSSLTDLTLSDELVVDVDYELRYNKILVINPDSIVKSIGNPARVHVEVAYVGGYDLSSDDSNLYNALVLQTVALYNRFPSLGVMTMSGNESSSRGASGKMDLATTPDAGSLLETVEAILSPLIYYGDAVTIYSGPALS